MFYCEKCRVQRGWPDSYALSKGKCEICGANAVCYDVASAVLKEIDAQRQNEKKDQDDEE